MGSRDSWATLKDGICVSRPQSFQLSIAAPLPQVVYWTESHWLTPLKYSMCLSVVCCFTRSSETGNDFLLAVFIRFACRWVASMHMHAHMLLPYQGIHAKKCERSLLLKDMNSLSKSARYTTGMSPSF